MTTDAPVFATIEIAAHRTSLRAKPRIVITSTHPSPLAARRATPGLPACLGSAPFRRANEALAELGQSPIDWDLALA